MRWGTCESGVDWSKQELVDPQLSIISDSSCSRSSSPMAGSTSSSRWSSVNWLMSSSKSSTAEEASALEEAAARDAAVLDLLVLDWVGLFSTGLKHTQNVDFWSWKITSVSIYSCVCVSSRIYARILELNLLPFFTTSTIFFTTNTKSTSSVFWGERWIHSTDPAVHVQLDNGLSLKDKTLSHLKMHLWLCLDLTHINVPNEFQEDLIFFPPEYEQNPMTFTFHKPMFHSQWNIDNMATPQTK